MSTGDVVCTGWLIKSPPEKKLKRYAWRKRWFVLRRGRMSGDPDVLEYYRSKSSKKPIRTIDLKECEVQMHTEVRLVRREFQNQHLFVVKTSSRVFYLVAKTEEEMNSWVHSIGQICHFGPLDDETESVDSFFHTPPSPPVSPRNSRVASQDLTPDGNTTEESRSASESSLPLDYLFLSQCETGKVSATRCNSCSNSERSLEQTSAEYTPEDVFPSPLCANPVFSPFLIPGRAELTGSHPRPAPKPGRFSERRPNEGVLASQPVPIPRRVSLSGLDHVRRGEFESSSGRSWNKRLSLNLPGPATVQSPSWTDSCEESYVPMSSGAPTPAPSPEATPDGYIPMSPISAKLLLSDAAEAAPPPAPPRGLSVDLEPPPVNRDLKPRRRARPPPLDLRGLSTIRECPTHLPLSRTFTEPCRASPCFPLDRRRTLGGFPADQDDGSILIESRQLVVNGSPAFPWLRRSNLDYLSLDFNSASPSPVQKKAFLSDEHRVDYVQVDQRKTQALQNTKMEWTDVRQSKV
ncbi:hypothetical protein ANANG_G00151800 [Anguilla anguilla]|uniref:PH domain-containing protein n=1 Tax=Anguilla anguilla TaxID=7936 RepID=A0A9D3RVU7_ANGAN|nr:hypothetical protein ANANG_G00151800 [Anguilla anguilla]